MTSSRPLPGDISRDEKIKRMIRVDQAGEYGAKRIYAGQIAVLGNTADGPLIQHMADQEQKHLDYFNKTVGDRGVRPSLLQPLWHVGGFALGAATALMGREAAMACTVAVEEVIDEHYAAQAAELDDSEADLRSHIEEFRAEELEHRDTGLANDAENAPGYEVLTAGVKKVSKLAIWLAERV
ncbi:demethoxyubiquinone hydroxylase family protein [Alphaproteobacteria bacterium HT1-32]|nr:demethoxyubiquinone hydroxylase family protein [Alphaproteobacteria bacterium HT1-32]